MSCEESPSQGCALRSKVRESPETAAARRRAELAAGYLSEAKVLTKLDIDYEALAALRRQRRILAVWHPLENRHVYPPFQFHASGIISELEPLLALLREGSTGSGWSEIEWLITPHALLEAHTPADVLLFDVIRVLEVAKAEFSEGQDANW